MNAAINEMLDILESDLKTMRAALRYIIKDEMLTARKMRAVAQTALDLTRRANEDAEPELDVSSPSR